SVFIPKPGEPNHYYLFTMEEVEFNSGGPVASQPSGRGLSWFELDATSNGGLGAVVNQQQMLYISSYEGLCAIRNTNGEDYWILITDATSGKLRIYSVTNAGLQFENDYFGNFKNMIKASPNGEWIAVSSANDSTAILPFNTTTGIPGIPVFIHGSGYFEFSSASNYFYFGKENGSTVDIGQYNLSSTNIAGSYSTIPFTSGSFNFMGQMQLAPDHKIYFISNNFVQTYLNAITCASSSTPSIQPNLVTYGSSSAVFFGLPNFDNRIFYSTDTICSNVGLNHIENTESFNILNNPVFSNINIQIKNSDALHSNIEIINLTGEIIESINIFNQPTVAIDVSKLNSGFYLIKIVNEKGSRVKRFIKQ
ncbi:MAG: T9SS type A sorting domain-containing protein, partial [Bacteroidota bacterium]